MRSELHLSDRERGTVTLPRLEDKPDGVNTFAWIIEVSQAYRRETEVERYARQQIEFIRRRNVFQQLRAHEYQEAERAANRGARFG